MMKKGLQLFALFVFGTAVAMAFSDSAFADINQSSSSDSAQLATRLSSTGKLKMSGQVAVGSRRNATCELLATVGRSDGFSKNYNIMIKSSAMMKPRVFRAKDYQNTISANQSETFFSTHYNRNMRRINTNEKLQMYQEQDGSYTAIIYKGQSVLLSCIHIK